MTGSDEGGFRPHPGDPWHPGGTDDESSDETESAQTESALDDPESLAQEPKKRKKPKRQTRRERKADQTEADDLFEPGFDKTAVGDEVGPSEGVDLIPVDLGPSEGVDSSPADDEKGLSEGVDPIPADVEKGSPEGADPIRANDPFDAVLEQESPATRFQAESDEGGPPPAWTVDKPPDPEQVFPVEQPSWIGQTTGAAPGVEAVEFESEQVEEPEEETDTSSSEPDGSAADETIDVEPMFAIEPQAAQAPEGDGEIVGEYGVAGPEAFDALADDPTGEIDDWDSYQSDPEPRRRRRFGRRKDARQEEVIDDGFVGAATEPTASEPPDGSDSTFGRPAEAPAGVEAFDDWYEAEPVQKRGLFRRRRRPEPDVIEDGFVGGADDWAEQPVEQQFEDDMRAAPLSDAGPVGVDASSAEDGDEMFKPMDSGEQGDLFAEPEDSQPEDSQPVDQSIVQRPAPAEPEGLDQIPDAELEDVAHWEGDPGRLPAGWIADIDEDEAVAPRVAETPDTELVDESDGTWEGQAKWQAEPVDLFDIEEPAAVETAEEEAEAEAPQESVAIPEGYEPWHEGVVDAVDSGTDFGPDGDAGTYEYEQPLLQGGLPSGYEKFPGGVQGEEFELPEETMLSHLEPTDEGWVTDDVDATAMPTEAMDVPYPVDTEFDEEIYAAGGTIEHRDLAAAIAEAGEEQTQWQAISAAMPGMETGVLGFEDVADLGSGGEYVAPVSSNFGVRVATGLVLVVLLFGSLLLGPEAFAVFISAVVMLGLVEFYGALRRAGYLPLGLFGMVGGVGTLAATWFHGPLAIPIGVLLTSTVTFFFYAFSPTRRDALSNGGLTTLGVGWVVATAAFAIPIGRAEERVVLVFAIVAVTAATDIGAYWSGRTWGKRALAPILSPNKTTEGLVGAVAFAFAAAGSIGYFELGPFDLKSGLALGAVAAFLAPIGDLAESMIKRTLGVKDMGSILPGHGGILDRIDAFLFVIPAAWVLYEAIGLLG